MIFKIEMPFYKISSQIADPEDERSWHIAHPDLSGNSLCGLNLDKEVISFDMPEYKACKNCIRVIDTEEHHLNLHRSVLRGSLSVIGSET